MALRFHFGADFFVCGGFFQLHGQVYHADVRRGHAERHAGEFAFEGRQHHAYRFGRAGAGGDDVFENAAAAAPVFVAGAVHGFLGGGGGVHGGHEAALDAPFVVEHFGQRRQAVGGAGGVGHNSLARVAVAIDAIDEHGGVVFAGGGHDDLFCTGVDVFLRHLFGEEQAGGFDHHIGAHFVPFEVGGVALSGEADFFAVDDEVVAIDGNAAALEAAVHAVVLEHVGQIVWLQQIVDADDFDVIGKVLYGSAEYAAPDATETVDAYFDCHWKSPDV